MSTTIAIEDIIDANSHNSAMGLTVAWAETFRKYAMESYEELSDDPASSFNIFTHLTAQGAAKMMYEQAARISETNESTAILPKSLLNKMSSEELTGIFGTPASTTVAFCVKKDEIIKYSLPDTEDKVNKLIINKEMVATFESYPSFKLPYNVIINCKPVITTTVDETGTTITDTKYNIFANYDMPTAENDGMRNIFQIYNNNISSREMRFEGNTYICFFLKMFQINRKISEFYVRDPYTTDTTLTFNNLLVGVEVFRKPANSSTWSLMRGFPEGNALSTNSYNYSYDYKRNSQNYNILFSKMNDDTALKVGDTIRAIVYTTEGSKGNINFPFMIYNVNDLSIEYNQDLNDAYQNGLLNIICLAFARDNSSTGGKDSLTFEQIRANLIAKNYSRNILVTNTEIINFGATKGLSVSQVQQDLLAMIYSSSDKLMYDGMILSTGSNNLYFDISKKKKLLNGYNYYMIEPSDVFKYNKSTNRFVYVPSKSDDPNVELIEPWNEYVDNYNNADDVESVTEVSFPLYMRYENTDTPTVRIYDFYTNVTETLKFVEFNEVTTLDKLDISFLRVLRNPFKGSMTGTFDKEMANTYYLSFTVYTGENTINKILEQANTLDVSKRYVNSDDIDEYLKQYVLFDIEIVGELSGKTFNLDPTRLKIANLETMAQDGFIAYQATFETSNFVNDSSELQVRGVRSSLTATNDYNNYVSMDTKVHFKITGKFVDDDNNPTKQSCIAYETDSVTLCREISKTFNINFDIESKIPGYETYPNNIPETYKAIVYAKNLEYDSSISDPQDPRAYQEKVETKDGKVIFRIQGDTGTPKYVIARNVGDLKLEYTKVPDEDIAEGPSDLKEYYVRKIDHVSGGDTFYAKDMNDDYIYQKVEVTSFDPSIDYFYAKSIIRHKKGDYVWYDRTTDKPLDLSADELKDYINKYSKPLPVEYVGICKNVPWINRLYMNSEPMYETIHGLYNDLINRTDEVRKNLFDGGSIYCGLYRTSGKSKKFKAYKLSDGSQEPLNNVAMKFVFRVKYKDNDSLEYKESRIVNAVINYINNIGDNDVSIDAMFDSIKSAVPDILYINILQMNNYTNGEVQTILNDTSVTDEVLTVSQKIVYDSDGNISFKPNITVQVVQ